MSSQMSIDELMTIVATYYKPSNKEESTFDKWLKYGMKLLYMSNDERNSLWNDTLSELDSQRRGYSISGGIPKGRQLSLNEMLYYDLSHKFKYLDNK